MVVRDAFVEAAGIRTRVRHWNERGPETPMLVLHGFTGCIESMQGVCERLGRDRPVIALDLVGHGETEVPGDPGRYAMDACVDHVAATLDTLAIARPVHVLGYSMGGRVALSLAVAHPRRVRSLVLVGASPGLADPVDRAARVRADRALAEQVEREGLARFVDHWMALPLFESLAALGSDFLAALRAQRMRCDPRGLAHSLRGMGTGAMPPLHDHLPSVERPVCLVAGSRDAKFVALAEAMRYRLPDARCDLVEGVGHAAHLEDEAAFARIARSFLFELEEQEIRT